MNEIKVNIPGKPFTYILNSNGEYGGKLYFKGKSWGKLPQTITPIKFYANGKFCLF